MQKEKTVSVRIYKKDRMFAKIAASQKEDDTTIADVIREWRLGAKK